MVDSSSYNETLTAQGNAKHDSENRKWCVTSVKFDGSGDYISTPDPDSWNLGTGDFRMECWYRPDSGSLSTARRFLARGAITSPPDGQWCWGVGYNVGWGSGTRMNFADRTGGGINDHSTVDLSSYITEGTWQHYCLERYNGTLYFYVDGVLRDSSISCSHNLTPTGTITGYIGVRGPVVEGLKGWAEDFAIYDYSKEEGAASFSVPTGPLEDYVCDSTTTTTTSSSTTTTTTA